MNPATAPRDTPAGRQIDIQTYVFLEFRNVLDAPGHGYLITNPNTICIFIEAIDLLFAAKCRFLTSHGREVITFLCLGC